MNQQSNNRPQRSLMDKAVDIEPTGIIYNIKGSMVEQFVEEFLEKKGINGVDAVKAQVRSEGRSNPEVALYLFLNQNSNHIVSDINNIPAPLRNKVDKVKIRLSDDLKKILFPLCGNEIMSGKSDRDSYYVKLDIFRTVGLMFAVNPRIHDVIIADAKRIPGNRDSIMSVMKLERLGGISAGNDDKYMRAIDSIEKRK